MNIETIRNAIRRQPFVPFNLRLNDGRIFHVPHPEYIALSRREVYCINAETEDGFFLEPVLIASLDHAGWVEDSAGSAATEEWRGHMSNGISAKRR